MSAPQASGASGQPTAVDSLQPPSQRFPALLLINHTPPWALDPDYPELDEAENSAFDILMNSLSKSQNLSQSCVWPCKMKVAFWSPNDPSGKLDWKSLQVQSMTIGYSSGGKLPMSGQFMGLGPQENSRTHVIYKFKLKDSAKKALVEQLSLQPRPSVPVDHTEVSLNVRFHATPTYKDYPASEPLEFRYRRFLYAIYIAAPDSENTNADGNEIKSLVTDVKAVKAENVQILHDLIRWTNGPNKSATISEVSLHVHHIVWPSLQTIKRQIRLLGLIVKSAKGTRARVRPDSQIVEVRGGKMTGKTTTLTFRLDPELDKYIQSLLNSQVPEEPSADRTLRSKNWVNETSLTIVRSDGLYENAAHQKKYEFLLKLPVKRF